MPIIDISLINSNNSTAIDEIDRQISKACEEWGFFYVINHGVDLKLIQRAVDLGLEFFNLPIEMKNMVARTEVRRMSALHSVIETQFFFENSQTFKAIRIVN